MIDGPCIDTGSPIHKPFVFITGNRCVDRIKSKTIINPFLRFFAGYRVGGRNLLKLM
jgi:hypothetical protein